MNQNITYLKMNIKYENKKQDTTISLKGKTSQNMFM